MTMTELAARDAAEKRERREHNIAALEHQIAAARERHARTDSLERVLTRLRGEQS